MTLLRADGTRSEGPGLRAGIWIEVGRARLTPEELASLDAGAVVALDGEPGAPVRIVVDGVVAAQGRLVLDGGRPAVVIEKVTG